MTKKARETPVAVGLTSKVGELLNSRVRIRGILLYKVIYIMPWKMQPTRMLDCILSNFPIKRFAYITLIVWAT